MIFMAKEVTCRYCGDVFTPKLGKPGFVDECPDCLYAKTAPQIPHEQRMLAQLMGESDEARKSIKAFRRALLKLPTVSEESVDKLIVECFRQANSPDS